MKHCALLTNVTLMTLVFALAACNQGRKVKIGVGEKNDFALLSIRNPYGQDLRLEPVSGDTGSIGVLSGGQLYWLTGMPERTSDGNGTEKYAWKINGTDEVELRITENAGNEIAFLLRMLKGDSLNHDPLKWYLNFSAGAGEYFTGAFERVVDGPQGNSWKKGIEAGMDLRGQRVEMKVRPTVSAYAPFYLSSNHYGFFVKGTWPGVFDFCKEDTGFVQVAFEGPEMDFKCYLAASPKEIVQKHTLEAGPPFLPPRWAFGPWRWRDEHRNNKTYFDSSAVHAPYNSQIVEDILMMEAYGIPCTAYWIDRPWGPGRFGFDDYEIDQERLPNFEKMIAWLNHKNIELMLWICPWVYGDMAGVARERGYGLISREGTPWSQRRSGDMVVMDFTNPEAARWWGDTGPAKLAKMGIRGFKLDRGDGEMLVDSVQLHTASGTSYRENYNDYPRQYVKATYDAVEPVLGDDFVLFPRAQYTGSSRYGAMWAGDTHNSAEGLRSALIGMQRCAVMGYPLWTSDAGGYPKHLEREVAMRWIGFACFCPVMEVGPTNNRGFWGMDYEPSYDHELLAVWRFYSKLRMSLVDYIHGLAKTARETGMPVVRPLFLEYPDQAESWKDWTTFMLGDDLLVSVIWENGKTRQSVYLPAGETWIDLWENKEFKGGQTLEVDASLHQTPVFLRKGSDLVLPDLNELYLESVKVTAVDYRMSVLEEKEQW